MIPAGALLAALAVFVWWLGPADRRATATVNGASHEEFGPVKFGPVKFGSVKFGSERARSAGTTGGGWVASLDLMTSVMEAGLAPATAVALVASVLSDDGPLPRAAALVDVAGEAAWRSLLGDAELGELAAVFVRSDQSGAPVVASIRTLADEVRRTERAARMERARRVGVRTAAPLGLCFLPAFFVVAVIPTVVGLVGRVL